VGVRELLEKCINPHIRVGVAELLEKCIMWGYMRLGVGVGEFLARQIDTFCNLHIHSFTSSFDL
jgi:hypothetical protein